LSETEIDTLVLNLTQATPGSECSGPSFVIDSAIYDNLIQEIIKGETKGSKKM